MAEWQSYLDRWHGVRLERPAGWAVHPEPGGAQVWADGEGWNWAYGRWLSGDDLPTPQALANGAVNRLRSRLPDLRAFRSAHDPHVLLRLEASSPRGPLVGVLKVVEREQLLVVLGFMARRDDLPALRRAFERVLRSFRPLQPIPRHLWREPTEGAFTVQLPVDWAAQGGVQRDPASGFGQLVFQAVADQQGLTGVLLSTVPQMFVTGGGVFGMGVPGMPTCPYCDVPTFVQQLLAPQMRTQYPDLRVEQIRPLPQVRERLAREAAMLVPGYSQLLHLDAAQVSLLYNESGVSLRQRQEIHTFELPAAMMMPSYWVAETPWSYRAPAAQWAEWEPVLSGVAASFHIEPAWEAREAALRQQQVMAANRRTQSLQMMTCWKVSRDMDLIDDMLWSSYERRSAAQDRIAHDWSDAILGQRDITTPWGETIYGVEGGFNRYWVNAVGDVLASDDWLFEPGAEWTEVSGGQ